MNVALKTLPTHHQLNGVFGAYHGAMCGFVRVMVNSTSKMDEAIDSTMLECVLDDSQFQIQVHCG